MIIVTLFLLIFSSGTVSIFYNHKTVFKWIISLFAFWLILMNGLIFWSGHSWFIMSIFITPFILLAFKIIYDFYFKKISLNTIKPKLKNNIITIIILLSSFTLIVLTRLWVNKFNGDALYYADLSQDIKKHNLISKAFQYRIPAFYHLASLAKNPIDMYSIVGDLMQQFILSVVLIKIIKKYNLKIINTIIVTLLVIILYATTSMYATSSLNWSIVSISFLFIISLEKEEWTWMLMIPISFSFFSLSAILLLPISMCVVLFEKKLDYKKIIYLASTILIGTYIYIGSALSFSRYLDILLIIFASPLLVVPFIKDEKQLLINLWKWVPTISRNTLYKIIFPTISITISIILVGVDIYRTGDAIYYFTSWEKWLNNLMIVSFVALFIYGVIVKNKFNNIYKFLLAFVLIKLSYLFLVTTLNKIIPIYIYKRLSDPIIQILPIILFFEIVTLWSKDKNLKVALATTSILGFYFTANTVDAIYYQKSIWKFNDTISKRYYWITPKEMKVIKQQHIQKVFSDLPLYLMSEFKAIGTGVKAIRNNYFYGMAATMAMYKDVDIINISKKEDVEERFKYTIEYAEHFNDWSKLDQAQTFVFRNKDYAEKIMKHYSQFKNHSIEDYYIDGLYIMKK